MTSLHGVIERDQAPLVEGKETVVHGLHPGLCPSHLHLPVDLMNPVLPDQVSYGRVGDHDLNRQPPPRFPRLREKLLGEHPFQHEGELSPDLGLLVGWEDIDNPIDGFHA